MMDTNATVPQKNIPDFPFGGGRDSVNEMVAMLYGASHRKGNGSAKEWFRSMKLKLERLCKRENQNRVGNSTETHLKNTLWDFIRAAGKFELLYRSNCPMAGVLPGTMIKDLNRMCQQAKHVMLYKEY